MKNLFNYYINKIIFFYKKIKFKYTNDFYNSNILVAGKYTYGEPLIPVYNKDHCRIQIGNFCSIAQNVVLLLGGNHPTNFVSSFPFEKERIKFPNNPENIYIHCKGDIIIGNDVWIGRNVIVLSGIKIGDGAVVAAGSIVSKDVRPYSIVGGNPAKEFRRRFSDEIVNALLKIKWWDWDDSKINEFLPLISSPNVESFIVSQLGSNWKKLI